MSHELNGSIDRFAPGFEDDSDSQIGRTFSGHMRGNEFYDEYQVYPIRCSKDSCHGFIVYASIAFNKDNFAVMFSLREVSCKETIEAVFQMLDHISHQ